MDVQHQFLDLTRLHAGTAFIFGFEKRSAEFVGALRDCFGAENRAGSAWIIEVIRLHPPICASTCVAGAKRFDAATTDADRAGESVGEVS